MILLDIYVPSVDMIFDFIMETDVPVKQLIKEAAGILSHKLQEESPEQKRHFVLCSPDRQCILPEDNTLKECGIPGGSRLLLV